MVGYFSSIPARPRRERDDRRLQSFRRALCASVPAARGPPVLRRPAIFRLRRVLERAAVSRSSFTTETKHAHFVRPGCSTWLGSTRCNGVRYRPAFILSTVPVAVVVQLSAAPFDPRTHRGSRQGLGPVRTNSMLAGLAFDPVSLQRARTKWPSNCDGRFACGAGQSISLAIDPNRHVFLAEACLAGPERHCA